MTTLDPDRVPPPVRYLIRLAERWGVGDDYERDAAVEEATDEQRRELVAQVAAAPADLWTSLASDETSAANPSSAVCRVHLSHDGG